MFLKSGRAAVFVSLGKSLVGAKVFHQCCPVSASGDLEGRNSRDAKVATTYSIRT